MTMQMSGGLRQYHEVDGLQGSLDAGASNKSGDDLRGTVFERMQERASRCI